MICTTLNKFRDNPYLDHGLKKLLAGLGKTQADNEPLPYARIVEIMGIDGALWATQAEPQYAKEWRLFAVWCARRALAYTNDWRCVHAVCVAERYAHGMASEDQLGAAAWLAIDAARAAAWAAVSAAWAAMMDAALDADDDASAAALEAAEAAGAAAWVAALDAARATADTALAAERQAQTAEFLRIVS